MQLVDYEVHSVAKHTGGRVYWGGGSDGRKGKIERRMKNQIMEMVKWKK